MERFLRVPSQFKALSTDLGGNSLSPEPKRQPKLSKEERVFGYLIHGFGKYGFEDPKHFQQFLARKKDVAVVRRYKKDKITANDPQFQEAIEQNPFVYANAPANVSRLWERIAVFGKKQGMVSAIIDWDFYGKREKTIKRVVQLGIQHDAGWRPPLLLAFCYEVAKRMGAETESQIVIAIDEYVTTYESILQPQIDAWIKETGNIPYGISMQKEMYLDQYKHVLKPDFQTIARPKFLNGDFQIMDIVANVSQDKYNKYYEKYKSSEKNY